MEDIRNLLDEAIATELQTVSTMQAGSKEKSAEVENLAQLYKLKIEEAKLQADVEEKRAQRLQTEGATAVANAHQDDLLREQKIDRWVNVGLQVALTAGGWIAYTLWQSREQRFELSGTPSTPMFRALLSRMVPNLKR